MNQVLTNLDVEPALEGQFGEMPNASFGSLNAAGLVLDSAYQNISKKEWQDLIELAQKASIADRINDMFSGKIFNRSERRPVLHTALRNCSKNPIFVEGKNVMPEIEVVWQRIQSLCNEWDGVTEEEWEIMRTHTSLGANILHSTKKNGKFQNNVIRIAADIAASHHERWNGTGYPAGLSGEDIPLSARIMALSDMYDALVSVRPYKKSWTHEQAAEEIIRNKNVAFDPLIVEAFVLEKDNFKEIKNKFRDSSNLEKFKS